MQIQQYSANQLEGMIEQFAFDGYQELKECREQVDDCLAGQKTIKEKTRYLPPNEWQEAHPNEYKAFLRRALFPGETKYALDIYDGLFAIGKPGVKLPEDGRMNFIISRASVEGDSLHDVQLRANSEQMSHGLRCFLLDPRRDRESPFVIKEYPAAKFLRSHFTEIDGESVADFILLDESTSEYDLTTFSDRADYKLRILALDANGVYYQRSIRPDELKKGLDIKYPPNDGRTVYPKLGKEGYFDRIPFVWCGAKSTSGKEFDFPPLLSVAQKELKLYMAMAHHSQHIYMNTQEFLVFTGVGKDFDINKVCVGAGAGVSLDKADAKAFYVSTNGVGFAAEAEEISMLQSGINEERLSMMNVKSHQSGSVVGTEQKSRTAPLVKVVKTSAVALTKILKMMAKWMGYSPEEIAKIEYLSSFQFSNIAINLSEFIALCKCAMSGEVPILEEDLFNIARESGYVNKTYTWPEFKKQYDIELEKRTQRQMPLPQNNGNPFANQNQNGNGKAPEEPNGDDKQ